MAVLGFGEQQDEEKVFVALPEKGMFVIYFNYYLLFNLLEMSKIVYMPWHLVSF